MLRATTSLVLAAAVSTAACVSVPPLRSPMPVRPAPHGASSSCGTHVGFGAVVGYGGGTGGGLYDSGCANVPADRCAVGHPTLEQDIASGYCDRAEVERKAYNTQAMAYNLQVDDNNLRHEQAERHNLLVGLGVGVGVATALFVTFAVAVMSGGDSGPSDDFGGGASFRW